MLEAVAKLRNLTILPLASLRSVSNAACAAAVAVAQKKKKKDFTSFCQPCYSTIVSTVDYVRVACFGQRWQIALLWLSKCTAEAEGR